MVRNPDRIKKTLEVIERIWRKNPDLRLGQLITNAVPHTFEVTDIYNLEDDKILQYLESIENILLDEEEERYRKTLKSMITRSTFG